MKDLLLLLSAILLRAGLVEAVFRVLGDSQAWGYGVGDDETIASHSPPACD